jgi:hypothetical protein
MNYKKIILFCSIFLIVLPITNVKSFTHVDYINDGNYAFFLFSLEEGQDIQIDVTHDESGNFTLFLFNRRPIESYVKADKSLNKKIFTSSKVVNYSLDDNPSLDYVAPEEKIYYIEVILVANGPDTYTLTSSKDLTRYYLPIIPSYHLEIILISSIMTLGIIILIVRKKLAYKPNP